MALATADQQAELVRAYGDATARLRQALIQTVGTMWTELGSWREADAVAYLRQVVPLIHGATAAMAALTDTYLGQLLAEMTGVPDLGPPAAARGAGYARPAPIAEVYRRPFITTWTALAQGKPLPEAVNSGRARLLNIAATDLQLSKRAASHTRLDADPRVVGYRRVLMGSKSCAMCALAASQRYHKRRLLPIHPGCDCGVAPIVGTEDPGQALNVHTARDRDALEAGDVQELAGSSALHQAVAARFGAKAADAGGRRLDYRQLVVEHEHGELGTVMARKGDKFTGPGDLP